MSVEEPWTRTQRDVVIASYLGWTLDAFDFFLVVFVFDRHRRGLPRAHGERHAARSSSPWRCARSGALLFGPRCRPVGRRRALMLSVLLYSLLEFASRVRPDADGVPGAARAVRHRDGRGVGRRRGAGVRDRTAALARLGLGSAAGGLPERLPARLDCVRTAVRAIGWRGMFMHRRACRGCCWRSSSARGCPNRPPSPRAERIRAARGCWNALSGPLAAGVLRRSC